MSVDFLRDQIADEISGWYIGSGYYTQMVTTSEAREIANAIMPIVVAALARAWDEGWDARDDCDPNGCLFSRTDPLLGGDDLNPYRETT